MRHGELRQLGANQCAESRRCLHPRVAEPGREPRHLGARAFTGLPQLLRAALVVVQLEQPVRRVAGPGENGVGVLAVLAGQRGEHRATLLQHAKTRRVAVVACGVRREVGADVRQQVPDLGQPVVQARERTVMLTHLAQRVPRARDQRRRVGAVDSFGRAPLHGRVRLLGRSPQRVGVAEPGVLVAQRVVFARLGVDGAHLGQPEAQQVGFLSPGAPLGEHLVQGLLDRAQLTDGQAQLGQQRLVPGEPVEGLALSRRLQQPQLVGLPVHGHQLAGQLGQHRDRDGPTAGVGARTPLRAYRPREQQYPLVQLGAGVHGGEGHRAARHKHHAALDNGRGGAGAHAAGIGAGPEQQTKAGDDHRLAGPGLAGDHGESGVQVEHGVTDDTQPANPHLLQHGAQPRSRWALGLASPAPAGGTWPPTGR